MIDEDGLYGHDEEVKSSDKETSSMTEERRASSSRQPLRALTAQQRCRRNLF